MHIAKHLQLVSKIVHAYFLSSAASCWLCATGTSALQKNKTFQNKRAMDAYSINFYECESTFGLFSSAMNPS